MEVVKHEGRGSDGSLEHQGEGREGYREEVSLGGKGEAGFNEGA